MNILIIFLILSQCVQATQFEDSDLKSILVIIFCLIVILINIIIILVYIKNKNLREAHGQILFCIFLIQQVILILTIIKYVHKLYDNQHYKLLLVSILTLVENLWCYYWIGFTIFCIQQLKNPLTQNKDKLLLYHSILIVISTVHLIIYIYFYQFFGLNFKNGEWIQSKNLDYFFRNNIQYIILIIIMAYSIFFYGQFLRQNYSKSSFVMLQSALQTQYFQVLYNNLFFLSILIVLNILDITIQDPSHINTEIFNVIQDFFKLSVITNVSFIRIFNSQFQKLILQLFAKKEEQLIKKEQQLTQNTNTIDQRLKIDINQSFQVSQDALFNMTIQTKNNISISMLGGILYHDKMFDNSTNNFQQIEFELDISKIQKQLPDYYQQMKANKLHFNDCKITCLYPQQFSKLQEKYSSIIDIQKSFNLQQNIKNIKKSNKPDGGAGGQFFLFSYDNRMILKTLSDQDQIVLNKNFEEYFEYINNNESLIAKIFGIFKFDFCSQHSETIMLMRNISGVPEQCLQRKFDLKGSTYNREVFKPKQNINLFEKVLKDVDFKKLEKNIFINKQDKLKLLNIIQNDIKFLNQLKLMDYSLLVIISDTNKINNQKNIEELQQYLKSLHNEGLLYNSVQNKDYKYHFAIIDYLQEYNNIKKMEKVTKNLMNLQINKLDTSSQDHDFYSKRFLAFIDEIFE